MWPRSLGGSRRHPAFRARAHSARGRRLYHLLHSLGTKRDRLAAESVAAAADLAGVRQFVFLGGLGDDREDLSAHLRSRTETARRLAAGPVPVTIVRSAVVVAGGSAAFETIVALVDRLPEMAGA